LAAVVDPVEEARRQSAAELGVEALADHRPFLGRIDAAIVATPTRQHYAVALDLLQHGIHVFVEKPITTSVADADELVAVAQARGLVLQVGHVERFNPAFVAAEPHLAAARYLEAVRCGPFTGRSTDIGVVLDLMIHDLDLVLSLVQSEVVSVDALGAAVFGPNEDWAQARLVFASGAVAHLRASRVSPHPQRTLDAWSSDRQVHVDFGARRASVVRHSLPVQLGQIDVQRLSAAERSRLQERLFTELLPLTELSIDDTNAIVQEQREFLAAVVGAGQVRVSGHAGREALEVAERVLAAMSCHHWDGSDEGAMGPHFDQQRPPVLSGPHWRSGAQASHRSRRLAG
jgi:predicted dehydrogenase